MATTTSSSSITTSYNLRSPAVKRLLQEARELQQDQCGDYTAQPLEDNLFEWHFVIRGPEDTEFSGGRYHGRILLPSEYPFKPPNLMLLTPNGRFELNKKICLNITGFHPEYWLPAWGIRTVLLGLIGFLTTKANGAIGGIDYTESERKILAQRSRNWKCSICDSSNIDLLPDDNNNNNNDNNENNVTEKNAKGKNNNCGNDENMPLFSFTYEDDKKNNNNNKSNDTSPLKDSAKSLPSSSNESSESASSTSISSSSQSTSNSTSTLTPTLTPSSSSIPKSNVVQSSPSRSSSRSSLIMLDTLITILIVLVLGLIIKKFF